jgi:hypothetical protein
LTGLAHQQRDFHAANQAIQNRTLELVEEIKDDVADMRTDFALVKRDVDELKAWRLKTADPTLDQFRDGVSQAKGASRLVRFLYAAGLLGGGGVLYKFGAALLAALPK